MAKAKKKGNGKKAKKTKAPKRAEAKPERKAKPAEATDLDALRAPVVEAKNALDALEGELKALTEKAEARIGEARGKYVAAVAPYRAACRKADHECEFAGGRGTNVSERVAFIVEKTDRGVRVEVKGRPDTAEVLPLAALKASLGKAAYGYTDKHLGPKSEIGNKGGGLRNRLAAALAGKREGGKA